ncbi:MAG: tyrosine-type recombinase/integrase [Planctomycetes bacterium]|nr:tyrosine-type recombinase/integrase [Planctomycetota bacterium]
MAKTKKKAVKYPGIEIRYRERKQGPVYLARWVEPLTLKRVEVSLKRFDITSLDAAKGWASDRSKKLMIERAEVAKLAADPVLRRKKTREKERAEKAIEEALKAYFDARGFELKASTIEAYEQGTKPFVLWCHRNRRTAIGGLDGPDLSEFRNWFIGLRKTESKKGKAAGRGSKVESKEKRSNAQVNKCLNSLRVVLNELRRMGFTPHLTSDDIRDSLKYVPRSNPLPLVLRNDSQTGENQIQMLLDAAHAHDATAFEMTRAEKAEYDNQKRAAKGKEPSGVLGSTKKYQPIAPFIRFVLLTGCRLHEAADLPWSEVDVGAKELRLDAERIKTRAGRIVPLDMCPSIIDLLKKLKPASPKSKYVFGPMRKGVANAAKKRLMKDFEAPYFTWQMLRRCAGTYHINASGVPGHELKQVANRLGHGIVVADKNYWGVVRIPPEAQTLEQAMGIYSLETQA